jgi:class 3 adenylate cyclase/YHS domain-containing protein
MDPSQLKAQLPEHRSGQTFLFADLAGFTALTETHGDERAADLVGEFCDAVRALLPGHEAEEVKAIGDALLLRAVRADQAVRLALAIVGEVGARHGFPSVRIGMHTGQAVVREGDWFGATVNVASRVSDHAKAGEVLATRATRDAVGSSDAGIDFRSLGQQRLKNVRDPLELFAIYRVGALPARRSVTDPVCRMALDPDHAEASVIYRGRELHFCSQACADAFAATPERYEGRRSRSLELRVSDRARERGVSFLRRSYARGELSLAELDERISHAYASRTRAELDVVLRDLPSFRRWQLARRRRRMFAAYFPPFVLARVIRRLWRRRSTRRS